MPAPKASFGGRKYGADSKLSAHHAAADKPPWYIDLLNVTLDNHDLATAGQRIQQYMDAFSKDGSRITRNLDFDRGEER